MPARIDPDQRRRDVIDAAFRCVVAEGLEGVSFRKVAAAAGLNVGSVRHYFADHHDLLTAAAQEAGDRMGARLAGHPTDRLRGLKGQSAVDALQDLIESVMPVDSPRRDEAIVIIELIAASRTKPELAETSQRMAADLSAVIREALDALGVPDADTVTGQIAAVIGGLTLDAVTPHGGLTVARVRAVLRAQLSMVLTGGVQR